MPTKVFSEDPGRDRKIKRDMKLRTRIFELSTENYTSLTELARVMGISISQIYRVKRAERPISEKFIIGAIKAFPTYKLNELFYIALDGGQND